MLKCDFNKVAKQLCNLFLYNLHDYTFNISVRKSFFPVKIVNCSFNKISIRFLIVANIKSLVHFTKNAEGTLKGHQENARYESYLKHVCFIVTMSNFLNFCRWEKMEIQNCERWTPFFCEFNKIFRKSLLVEHFLVTASVLWKLNMF